MEVTKATKVFRGKGLEVVSEGSEAKRKQPLASFDSASDIIEIKDASQTGKGKIGLVRDPTQEDPTNTFSTLQLEAEGFQAAFEQAEANLRNLTDQLAASRKELVDELAKAQRTKRTVSLLKRQISGFESSLSWRITKPVRHLERLAKIILRLAWWTVTLQLVQKFNERALLRRQYQALTRSNLFDRRWYLATYPQAAKSKLDPILHYLLHGAALGYSPGPVFDGAAYSDAHLKHQRDINPLYHYLTSGQAAVLAPPSACKQNQVIPSAFATNAENYHWYLSPESTLSAPSVIYVSGTPHKPGEIYRVCNQVEALREAGITAFWVRIRDIEKVQRHLVNADILVIYRHGGTPALEAVVSARRETNLPTVFDIDDLVICPEIASDTFIDAIRFQKLNDEAVRKHYDMQQKMLLKCDAGFASTSPLAAIMAKLGSKSFIIPNGFGSAQLQHSAIARSNPAKANHVLRVGYSSGSRTHQKDFGVAASSLSEVMRKHTHVVLTSFEATLDLEEFSEFAALKNRIELRSLVPLDYLPYELARFDINIAPLEVGNLFCECKSQLKFYEAALVGVPTIASPTKPLTEVIIHGVNGLLAATENEWLQCLDLMIGDAEYRRFLGQNAMRRAHAEFGLQAQASASLAAMRQLAPRAFTATVAKAPDIQISPHRIVAQRSSVACGLATIVIPLFNYSDCIGECLQSIKRQTIAEQLDVIVVDDDSTDNSLEATLSWFEADPKEFNAWTIIRHDQNSGLADTRNTGVSHSELSYYFALDADNKLHRNCVEKCLVRMRRLNHDNTIGAVYPSRYLFGEETALFAKTNRFVRIGGWDRNRLAQGNYIDAMALIKKSAWRRVGGYTDVTERGGWQDYDFWCKFVELGLRAEYESTALAFYRTHRNSMLHKRTHKPGVHDELKAKMQEKHSWLRLDGGA